MRNRRNYYRVLHVQPDAPAAIVKASYRTLMQKLKAHPDLGGDIANAQLLNEAYQVISNPEKRAHYDNDFHLKTRKKSAEKPAPPPKKNQTKYKEKPQKAYSLQSKNTKTLPAMSRRDSVRCKFCHTSQSNLNTHAAHSIDLHAPSQCAHCSSPLNNLAQLNLNASCKRATSRIDREGRMQFFTQWPQAKAHRGIITDISPNGLGFQSTIRLKLNRIIKINSSLLNAVIKVVNHRQIDISTTQHHLYGAEFLSVEFSARQGTFFSQRV